METFSTDPRVAGDFVWHWLAARAVLHGLDPYTVIQAGGQYNLEVPYIYPLPAALVAIPFALFPLVTAFALFAGVGTALFVWAITRENYHALPVVLSLPFIWAVSAGQFAPLVMAAALMPNLGWLALSKPNIGIGALAFKPTKRAIIGSLVFLAVTLIINPYWLIEWKHSLAYRIRGVYLPPILLLGGPVILLGLLRWRRAEARLLVILALLPQTILFYDQILLWLVPRTWKEGATLSALSWLAMILGNYAMPQGSRNPATVVAAFGPMIVAFLFLPCVIMVLRRANEGELLERFAVPRCTGGAT